MAELPEAAPVPELSPAVEGIDPLGLFASVGLDGLDPSGFVDDRAGDPFAGLDPQWRRLAGHLLEQFDPSSLPLSLRMFAPAAVGIMAEQLGRDPIGNRATALELIDLAVRDLGIPLAELRDSWDAEGMPTPPAP